MYKDKPKRLFDSRTLIPLHSCYVTREKQTKRLLDSYLEDSFSNYRDEHVIRSGSNKGKVEVTVFKSGKKREEGEETRKRNVWNRGKLRKAVIKCVYPLGFSPLIFYLHKHEYIHDFPNLELSRRDKCAVDGMRSIRDVIARLFLTL